MSIRFDSERREFIRVNVDIPVRYKFLSKGMDLGEDGNKVYEGTTGNLGGGGMLLIAKIPHATWFAELLAQRIVVGTNVLLPLMTEPVKALCRVAWIEGVEGAERVAMGLMFREITRESQDEIFRFVIKAQLK